MNLKQLVLQAKKNQPALANVPDEQAAALLSDAFHQINLQVMKSEQGVVKVGGLGQFRVKQVEREVDGKTVVAKRVIFQVENPPIKAVATAAPSEIEGAIPQIQANNATRYNRYEKVFAAVKGLLPKDPEKILSFGCSYGDEPLSLAELWFPKSRILGLDVSEECLAAAREKTRPVSDRVVIAHSSQKIIDEWAPFDVAFAMSVLCAWPQSKELEDISPLYTFAEFEKHVALLNEALKPGGLLVIWNASFRFTDAALSSRYEAIPIEGVAESGFVKKFDTGNKALRNQDYALSIFRKIG